MRVCKNLSVSLLPWESEKLVINGRLNHKSLLNPKPSPLLDDSNGALQLNHQQCSRWSVCLSGTQLSQLQFGQRVCRHRAGRDGPAERVLCKVADMRASGATNNGQNVAQQKYCCALPVFETGKPVHLACHRYSTETARPSLLRTTSLPPRQLDPDHFERDTRIRSTYRDVRELPRWIGMVPLRLLLPKSLATIHL